MQYQQSTKNIFFPGQIEPFYEPHNEESMKLFYNYWSLEKDRCINGFYLADGKVFIPGFLYWHITYFKIAMYVEKNGRKTRIIDSPLLRDIDWDIANDFEDCLREGKFYMLIGSRDFGKSILAASRSAWTYTFFPQSETVISAGESSYIKLATDKIEDGLTNIHPIFKKQRLTSDWKKEVRAGFKDKATNLANPKSFNSRILIRNYEAGNKSMAANGTRPMFHLIDEVGTLPNFIGCVKDSDGCWWSGDGDKPSCLSMFTGTGGDMEVGAEAAEMFFRPDGYNILEFENKWEDFGKIGRFIPATRAKLKYKKPQTLSQYLGIEHPDLDKITILVSDEEEALKDWWEPEYNKARKSGNPKTVLKFKAYWPLKPSDSFIVLAKNDYNIEAASIQKQKLLSMGKTGFPIRIYHNGSKLVHESVDKLPITEFPVKTQDKDAPIVMWEPPIPDPPFGLYVAGADPYRFSESEYSDSLGAIYIYKRMHSISGESYQDMFVASYVARPKSNDEWCENARNLIKYYNAICLCENDEMSFIKYMINKGDGHYLADQPQWLKEIVPTTTVNRDKGIHRSSDKICNYLRGSLKNYLDEVIHKETDDNGSVIKEVLGVSRIFDPMLLEEIIRYNKDDNFDREVAASLAIAYANHLDPAISVGRSQEDPRFKALFSKEKDKNQNKLFKSPSKMFGTNRRKLFR